jgi:hypothetical protein
MSAGPDDKLLMKYAMGQCALEEQLFVEEWLKSDPDVRMKLERFRLMFQTQEQVQDEEGEGSDPSEKPEIRLDRGYAGMVLLLFLMILIGLIIIRILNH